MTITVQSRKPGGVWGTRNAFVTENKMLTRGLMTKAVLLAKANQMAREWHTYQDGHELRVHDTDAPEPQAHSLGAAAVTDDTLDATLTAIARVINEAMEPMAPTPLPAVDWSSPLATPLTGQDVIDAAHDHARDLRKHGEA